MHRLRFRTKDFDAGTNRVSGFGFRVYGFGFQGEFQILPFMLRVSGFGLWASGLGFGFGLRVWASGLGFGFGLGSR